MNYLLEGVKDYFSPFWWYMACEEGPGGEFSRDRVHNMQQMAILQRRTVNSMYAQAISKYHVR